MNTRLLLFSLLLALSFSCKKEYSCEDCLTDNPVPPPTTPPVDPPTDPPVVVNCEAITNTIVPASFVAQEYHNLVVLPNGTVKSWGSNMHGRLGDGTTINRPMPVQVVGLTNIVSVAAGATHSMALSNDGKVWTWGNNESGQLGNGSTTNSSVPVRISSLNDIVAIAAGFDFSVALKKDGTVWAWGWNLWGVYGNGSYTNISSPVQVNICKVVSIAAGLSHVVALRNDGTVWTWGWNMNGILGDGSSDGKRAIPQQVPGLSGIKVIAANETIHTLALKDDGTLWAWGNNGYGQIGDGSYQHKFTPVKLALSNVIFIATGANSSFAIQQDGKVWAWGWNAAYNLGIEIFNSYHTPNPLYISQLSDIKAIVGGYMHTLLQKNNGAIWAMGGNVFGQLGDGTSVTYRLEAKPVLGL